MCKNNQLNNRQRIIDEFPIYDRKPSYETLNEAIEDAVVRAFKDINFRTLEKNDLGTFIIECIITMCQKKSNKDQLKTSFQEKINNIKIEGLDEHGEEKNRQLKQEEKRIIEEIFEEKKWSESYKITSFLIDHLRKVGFITRFENYFEITSTFCNDAITFDKWHHDTCELFLSVLTLYYKNAAYGKAQKIVNMTFKHLYCMKVQGILLDEVFFKYCHLTLDYYTLEWFKREVATKWYNTETEKPIKTPQDAKPFPKWSNIKYRDEKGLDYNNPADRELNNWYHYMFFETMVRNCFNKIKPYGECTAFQAEFYFWPEIQIHIAVDELFGQQVARDQVLSLLDDSLDNYKKTYQDEKAIVNCIEKYKTEKSVRIDETAFDAQERTFNNAKKLFRLLPLNAKIPYMEKITRSIADKCKKMMRR